MQVDFYILDAAAELERLRTACRLADKAWQKGHRVFIHTGSRETARAIDDMLWTYRQDSFVPHAMYGDRREVDGQGVDEDTLEPVLVGDGSAHPAEIDVLINLAETVPSFAGESARVAEIVGAGDSGRRAGRVRYRDYRDRGVSIQQHNL
jgi:DNA polymerase-3 subunit chi